MHTSFNGQQRSPAILLRAELTLLPALLALSLDRCVILEVQQALPSRPPRVVGGGVGKSTQRPAQLVPNCAWCIAIHPVVHCCAQQDKPQLTAYHSASAGQEWAAFRRRDRRYLAGLLWDFCATVRHRDASVCRSAASAPNRGEVLSASARRARGCNSRPGCCWGAAAW
jgi:hypothetical protein